MNLDIVRKLLPARKDVQINSPISTLHYKVRKANKGPLKYYVILFGGWGEGTNRLHKITRGGGGGLTKILHWLTKGRVK